MQWSNAVTGVCVKTDRLSECILAVGYFRKENFKCEKEKSGRINTF